MENKLPEGWVATKIGCYYKLVKDKIEPTQGISLAYVGLEHLVKGGGFESIGDSNDVKSTKTLFKKGDVLYGKLRPYLNKHAFVEFDGVCSTDILAFRSPSTTSAKYLDYYLGTPATIAYAVENSQGINLPRVSGSIMGELPIPLPPLAEQKRIVAKLDAAFAHLETLKTSLVRIPELLKKFRQTVLTQSVTGKLTEDINKGSKYTFIKLENFCKSSFYGPRFSNDEYNVNGIPTVRTTDMKENGQIEITQLTPRVLVSQEKIENFRVNKGDLLITRTGSIGKMAIFESEQLAIPSAYLIRFRFKEDVSTKFIFYCLTSPYGQRIMGLEATAITQANLNANKIKSIEVPDIGFEEQQEIVNRIEALFALADALEAQYISLRAKIDKLPQALLAKAFRGELVPQDPADEPASVILEKIKAATANISKKKTSQTSLAFMEE